MESEVVGGTVGMVWPEGTVCLCQQPRDESSVLIQCEHCEMWYHLGCLERGLGVVIFQKEAALTARRWVPVQGSHLQRGALSPQRQPNAAGR